MSSSSESDFDFSDQESVGSYDLDSDEESFEDDLFPVEEEEKVFLNKKGDFQWSTRRPANDQSSIGTSSKHDASFNIDLKSISSPLLAFLEVFDSEMLDKLVEYTNGEAKVQGDKRFTPVERCSILAWMGILINAGRLHANRVSIDELWTTDSVNGTIFYRATMSRQRFKEITRYVRFDDTRTRRRKKSDPNDRLWKVRWFLEKLRDNFSTKYNPSGNLTVDERMVPYRGRCIFIIYIKAKPHPYGIKIWAICDAENSYFIFFEVYAGKIYNYFYVKSVRTYMKDFFKSQTCFGFYYTYRKDK